MIDMQIIHYYLIFSVVMFVDEDNVRRLLHNLDTLIKQGNTKLENYFWWIASDSWFVQINFILIDNIYRGMKPAPVAGVSSRAQGAITIAPDVRVIDGRLSILL